MHKLAVFCGDSIQPNSSFVVSPTRFLALEHFAQWLKALLMRFLLMLSIFDTFVLLYFLPTEKAKSSLSSSL